MEPSPRHLLLIQHVQAGCWMMTAWAVAVAAGWVEARRSIQSTRTAGRWKEKATGRIAWTAQWRWRRRCSLGIATTGNSSFGTRMKSSTRTPTGWTLEDSLAAVAVSALIPCFKRVEWRERDFLPSETSGCLTPVKPAGCVALCSGNMEKALRVPPPVGFVDGEWELADGLGCRSCEGSWGRK